MTKLWGPISTSEWRDTPSISGRVALEVDVDEGRAVYFINGHSEPALLRLPFCALHSQEDGTTKPVVVIQAEHVKDQIILGIRPLKGGNGICLLTEVQILESGFEAALPPNTSLERSRDR
jgi:hypothetical protein